MKIKEVAQRTGLSADNIRYYEREGLIAPGRDEENGYRVYGEQDVLRLQKIKALRVLGIPISDIRALIKEEIIMKEVIKKRQKAIEEEQAALASVKKTCDALVEEDVTLDKLEAQAIETAIPEYRSLLQRVLLDDLDEMIHSLRRLPPDMIRQKRREQLEKMEGPISEEERAKGEAFLKLLDEVEEERKIYPYSAFRQGQTYERFTKYGLLNNIPLIGPIVAGLIYGRETYRSLETEAERREARKLAYATLVMVAAGIGLLLFAYLHG